MRRIGHGVNRVGLRAEPDPAGAADEFFRAETDAPTATLRHDLGDFRRHFGRLFRTELDLAHMVLLEERTVVEQHHQFAFALDHEAEIRM